ncbi:MAG: hypothetical protein R3C26_20690 [Calditrichia bacterium]
MEARQKLIRVLTHEIEFRYAAIIGWRHLPMNCCATALPKPTHRKLHLKIFKLPSQPSNGAARDCSNLSSHEISPKIPKPNFQAVKLGELLEQLYGADCRADG